MNHHIFGPAFITGPVIYRYVFCFKRKPKEERNNKSYYLKENQKKNLCFYFVIPVKSI